MDEAIGTAQDILVVEDSRTQALRLQFLLEQEGYQVRVCENGNQALQAVREARPALVISDIVMPEMDGYTLCRKLKTEEGLAEVPVLLVTTLADPEDVLRGLGSLADGFIVKPFDERFLLNRVRFVLLNRKMRQSDRADMGLNITVHGQQHFITSDRLQILNLLLSTFEAATQRNQELRRSEENLRFANAALFEANAQLRDQIAQRERAEAEVLRLTQQLLEDSEARRASSEERLHEQEALLHLAGQMARVGAWSLRLSDGLLYWSEQVGAIHGTPPDYRPTLEESIAFYAPESREAIRAAVEACCSEGRAFDLEGQVIATDGRRVSVRAMGRAVRDADGRVVRVEGAFQDVTERNEQKEQLHQLARRMTTTLESMSDAFLTVDTDWRFVYLNSQARRLLQVDSGEVLGRNIWEVFPQARGSIFDQQYHAAMRTGNAVRFEAHYPALDLWLEVRAYPSSEGLAIHFSDISARRRGEEERRELTLLLDRAKDAIVVRDLQHRATFWNAAAERLYGWTRAEALGRPVTELHHRGDVARFEAANAALARDGEWSGRLQLSNRSGGALVVDAHWTLLRDDAGQATGVLAINTDARERVEWERRLAQSQRLEAIGKLTGGIAHDFNNFLTVIIGNAELLAEELSGDGRLAPLAAMVQKAGERGAELTGRLLAFARRQTLEPELVDPRSLVLGMRDLLARALGPTIELTVTVPESLPPLSIDIGQFESSLLNLCVNARDAMPRGGHLLIEVDLVHVEQAHEGEYVDIEAGEYVRIGVSDTGTGMPPEVLAHAFEPFFTTKEKGKGTGLGLSMIYGFTRQSGGQVTIYSEPGQGTTVKLYLPRAEGTPDATFAPPAEVVERGGDERVLLVEDDELVRQHALNLLTGLGYQVAVAANAAEALELLRSGEPVDLLFTDVIMPGGMNGPELALEARRLRPGLPVLFASGYTEQAIEQQGNGNVPNLLHKPYRRSALARKLRATLAAKGTPEQPA